MANLVSAGVSVSVTDDSFFIPASASTVPLFFIATADRKTQPNGTLAAAGTYEHDVIRTVSSLRQSTELYGTPRFLTDGQGNQLHGDARNEYGLFALNQFLGIGSMAYVIRANVNLNDNIADIRDMWDDTMQGSAYVLENLAAEYIQQYNAANGYSPSAGAEGHQHVFFTTNKTLATVTDLSPSTTYTATVVIDDVSIALSVAGTDAATIGDLLNVINGAILNAGTASLTSNGQLQITSLSKGFTSTVEITDGNLFSSIAGFDAINDPVAGVGYYKTTVNKSELMTLVAQATADAWTEFSFRTLEADFVGPHATSPVCTYSIYGNGYDSPATSCFEGLDGIATNWTTNLLGATPHHSDEWTPAEAANTLLQAADEIKYTTQFMHETSLGANDAARRVSIVTALQAAVNSNTNIRSETYEYNLIVCPGYHEVVDELVALSADILEEAFVIADTPFNLSPEDVANWAATSQRQSSTNVAYYYPHGMASNLDGTNVFVAASGTALRTITYSDNASHLWMAPAGVRRGTVTGLSQVGYVSGTLGTATTFVESALNQGQRDNLYKYFTNINPITFFPGRGIVVNGQKTSAPAASAMDRINVVRLVMYIRRQLRKNAMPFVFEPNDQLTRDNLKAAVDGFLGDLIVKRALYDFATVCDTSNNTPDRIDRNELHLDIAIKPVKAAEFIYIPIRVVNTGTNIS